MPALIPGTGPLNVNPLTSTLVDGPPPIVRMFFMADASAASEGGETMVWFVPAPTSVRLFDTLSCSA